MERKYNYVYRLRLKDDPRYYYIGKHSSDKEPEKDTYTGSGRGLRALKDRYGKDCFSKEILQFCNSCQEAFDVEASLVTEEVLRDPFCLNRVLGGGNNAVGTVAVKDVKGNRFRVSIFDPRYVSGELVSTNLGHVPSEKTRQLWKKQRKGRSAWNRGVPPTEEVREKLRKANLGKKVSKETKEKLSEIHTGTIAIHKGEERRRIKGNLWEQYKSEGWQKGWGIEKVRIYRGGEGRVVPKNQVKFWIEEGWVLGGKPKSQETKTKISQKASEMWRREGFRERMSEIQKTLWKSEEYIKSHKRK